MSLFGRENDMTECTEDCLCEDCHCDPCECEDEEVPAEGEFAEERKKALGEHVVDGEVRSFPITDTKVNPETPTPPPA